MSRSSPLSASTASVFDPHGESWVRVDHASPDVLLGDVDLNGGPAKLAPLDEFEGREIWKTLVRYVWHNARSMGEACVFFGVAAVSVLPEYARRMLPDEIKAIRQGGGVNGHRAARVFHFRERMVYRVWQPLLGYTPLSALLLGEHDEYMFDQDAQAERRNGLSVIFRAAWQDLAKRKWEASLRGAFANFTAITAEDRDLLAWVTQTEFARAFDETRAAMCARRRRRVRVVFEKNGQAPPPPPGGKSEGAIAKYREVQKGNRNRSGGHEAEAVCDIERSEADAAALRTLRDHRSMQWRHDLVLKPGVPREPRAQRAFLDELAAKAEARRLAALCGVGADEINLSKTKPSDNDHEQA